MNNQEEQYYFNLNGELNDALNTMINSDNKSKMAEESKKMMSASAGKEIKGIRNLLSNYMKATFSKLENDTVMKLDEYDAEMRDRQEELAEHLDQVSAVVKKGIKEVEENPTKEFREASSDLSFSRVAYDSREREYIKNIFLRNNITNYKINEKKISIFTKFSLKRNAAKQSDILYNSIKQAFADYEKGLNGITYRPFDNLTEAVGYNAAILYIYTELRVEEKLSEVQKRIVVDKILSRVGTRDFSMEMYNFELMNSFPQDQLTEYTNEVEISDDAYDQEGNLGFHFAIYLYNEWLQQNTSAPFKVDTIVSKQNADQYFDMILMVMYLKEKGISQPIDFATSKELIAELMDSMTKKDETNKKTDFIHQNVDENIALSHIQLVSRVYMSYQTLPKDDIKKPFSLMDSNDYKEFSSSIYKENNPSLTNLLVTITQFCESGIMKIWEEKYDTYQLSNLGVGIASIVAYMTETHTKVLEEYNFLEKSDELFKKQTDEVEVTQSQKETDDIVAKNIAAIKESVANQVEQMLNESKDMLDSEQIGVENQGETNTVADFEDLEKDKPNHLITAIDLNPVDESKIVATMQQEEYDIEGQLEKDSGFQTNSGRINESQDFDSQEVNNQFERMKDAYYRGIEAQKRADTIQFNHRTNDLLKELNGLKNKNFELRKENQLQQKEIDTVTKRAADTISEKDDEISKLNDLLSAATKNDTRQKDIIQTQSQTIEEKDKKVTIAEYQGKMASIALDLAYEKLANFFITAGVNPPTKESFKAQAQQIMYETAPIVEQTSSKGR